MELRNIDTFLKVASTQNFSKAAEQLGYSQSAITVQIQKLEKELGVQLFERIGKRVYLTSKGEEFIFHATEIMKAANSALSFSKDKMAPKGRLRIGGVESICTALLPELLLDFYKQCPEVEVIIRSGSTNNLLELAMGNELDLVFTLDRKQIRSEWTCAVEKEEEIIFVSLPSEKQSYRNLIPFSELSLYPFILTENGAAYRYELERIISPLNIELRPILEIGNTETIINLLKRGMGISFLPRFTVCNELQNHTLAEIQTDLPPVKMHHQILYHKNKWISPQMDIFINLAQTHFIKKGAVKKVLKEKSPRS